MDLKSGRIGLEMRHVGTDEELAVIEQVFDPVLRVAEMGHVQSGLERLVQILWFFMLAEPLTRLGEVLKLRFCGMAL